MKKAGIAIFCLLSVFFLLPRSFAEEKSEDLILSVETDFKFSNLLPSCGPKDCRKGIVYHSKNIPLKDEGKYNIVDFLAIGLESLTNELEKSKWNDLKMEEIMIKRDSDNKKITVHISGLVLKQKEKNQILSKDIYLLLEKLVFLFDNDNKEFTNLVASKYPQLENKYVYGQLREININNEKIKIVLKVLVLVDINSIEDLYREPSLPIPKKEKQEI